MNIQGLGSTPIINIKTAGDVLSKLTVGDKINVQVIGINNNELTLRLPGGGEITATVTMNLDVNLGDFLDLNVKTKTDSQIELQTTKIPVGVPGEPQREELTNILLSLKMPPDDRNIDIAKGLISQNMPLNMENIQKVISTARTFGLDIKSAVFFVANNLEQVTDAANVLNKLSNNELKLSENLNSLTAELSKSVSNDDLGRIIDNYNTQQLNKQGNKIANNEDTIINLIKNYDNSSKMTKSIANNVVEQLIDIFKFSENNNDLKNAIKQNFANAQENINAVGSDFDTNIQNAARVVSDKGIQTINNNSQVLTNILDTKLNPEIKNLFNGSVSENEVIGLLDKIDKGLSEFVKNNTKLTEELVKLIKSTPKTILEHDNNMLAVKNAKNDIFSNIKEFLKVPLFKDGRTNFEDAAKVLDELNTKITAIDEYIKANPVSNNEQLAPLTGEIKNSINFMNNVNNNFVYYQVPINVNLNQTEFDLYVAKRERKSKIDPKNTSIFISLNTNNLGLVESLISINYKSIDFNFRLQDKRIIDLFEKNRGILEELITDKGYSINKLSFSCTKDRTNILNADNMLKSSKKGNNAVDVKI